MADTLRDDILDAVKARLQTILTASGYRTNLGQNVDAWRLVDWPESTSLACSVEDTKNEPVPGAIGKFRWGLSVRIVVMCIAGSSTAATLRNAIEDVYKAIGTDPTWKKSGTPLAQSTDQPEDEMDIQHDNKIIGMAQITFRVIYDAAQWRM